LLADAHSIVTNADLLAELQRVIEEEDKADRQRAIQAKRYAKLRKEALVDWLFDLQSVARKDTINWAKGQIQK